LGTVQTESREHVDVPLYEGRGEDRLLTVFRGFSMIFVVGVHIGWAQVTQRGTGNEAAFSGWPIDLASWGIVWISLFFVVSGALMRNADKVPYRVFLRTKLIRLLMPYYVFVAVLVPVEIFISKAFPDSVCGNFSAKKIATWILPLHEDCLGLAQGPLWFLQVFLVFAILAPFIVRLFDSKARHWVIPGALFALALFDYLWLSGVWGRPIAIGAASAEDAGLLLVFVLHVHVFWGLVFYLGLYYADGYTKRFEGHYLRVGVLLSILTVLLVAGIPGLFDGPYGTQVFGYMWDGGNQFPPTLAWLVGTLAASAFILWARKLIVTWSWRPLVAPAIDWLSKNSLTLLIWHMVAYEIVYWTIRLTGRLPFFEETLRGISPVLERLTWLTLTIPLVLLITALFAPIEQINWGKYLWWPSSKRQEKTEPAEAPRP
jgi:hypothetical protein